MENNDDIIDIPTELEVEKPQEEISEEKLENALNDNITINNDFPIEQNEVATEMPQMSVSNEELNIVNEETPKTDNVAEEIPKEPDVFNSPLSSTVEPSNVGIDNPTMSVANEETPIVENNTEVVPVEPNVNLSTEPLVSAPLGNIESSTPSTLNPSTNPVSLDGNPDALDIEVKDANDKKPRNSKKIVRFIIIGLVILLVLGASGFFYYNYLIEKKANKIKANEKITTEIIELKTISSFEEAYKKVVANFDVSFENDNISYLVKDGLLEVTIKDKSYKVSIKDELITNVAYFEPLKEKDLIGLKDDKNNYYFATINYNINSDIELNYKDNKLVKVPKNDEIKNIAIANYLGNKGYFYLAEKENESKYITESDGVVTNISEIYYNVYNGINIDFKDLKINDDAKKKLNFSGVGLFYDGKLFIYNGEISNIKEIEVKYEGKSLNCKEIYLAYKKDLKMLDLYIISSEDELYQINLLTQEFAEDKINIKKVNLIKDMKYEPNNLDITLTDDSKITVK